jgi:cell division protein FtsZ
MEENNKVNGKVTVMGLGNSGVKIASALSRIPEAGWLDIIALDTDRNSLELCPLEKKFVIDEDWRSGEGCGGDVINGQRSFSRERNKIRGLLKDSSLLIVTGGLGGGTATGGISIVASEARGCKVPVIFLLSMPFVFEGRGKIKTAEDGVREMLPVADVLLCLPNDLLFSTIPADSPVEKAFEDADEQVARSIVGVSELLRCNNLLATDFSDIKAVLGKRKSACGVGVGMAEEGDGLNRCHLALERMLESPFLGGIRHLRSADAVFVSVTGGKDLEIGEVKKSLESVEKILNPNAKIIVGANTDDLYEGKVQITLISVEFDRAAGYVPKEESEPAFAPVQSAPAPPPVFQALSSSQDAAPGEFEQQELPLMPISRGIFLNSTPSMHDGYDLDIPTFQRENIIIDKGD